MAPRLQHRPTKSASRIGQRCPHATTALEPPRRACNTQNPVEPNLLLELRKVIFGLQVA